VGYYLLPTFGAPDVALLALVAANVRGRTKRAVGAGAVFVGYCVGNVMGPYLVSVIDLMFYSSLSALSFFFSHSRPRSIFNVCDITWEVEVYYELRTDHTVIVLEGQHDRSSAQAPHDMDLAYRVHGVDDRHRDGASRYAFEGECAARWPPPLSRICHSGTLSDRVMNVLDLVSGETGGICIYQGLWIRTTSCE
jgi:hypothetical protein